MAMALIQLARELIIYNHLIGGHHLFTLPFPSMGHRVELSPTQHLVVPLTQIHSHFFHSASENGWKSSIKTKTGCYYLVVRS